MSNQVPPTLRIKFDRHGLGDCVHFTHALQLYKRRGYDITVQVEENKKFIWQLACFNIVQGGGLPDHPYGYPGGFDDLNAPDHEKNKVAFGLKHDVMPNLSDLDLTSEQAWEELCGIRLSAHDHIPPEAHAEADRFLEGLPRPIICLHSRGTNWHERKSLPTEVAFDVILKLLDQTGGSVIVLDFDRRAPMVGDARCKGIKPGWGHIGIDRLCALFERSDLVIGVDSGPFHVAALTNVKALGVFRSLHPNRVCLPNPNAVYLINEAYQEQIDHPAPWKLATYASPEPTADDIVRRAIDTLDGFFESGATAVSAEPGRYLYTRVGHDERIMELLPGGLIGEGSEGCERQWKVESGTLNISGKDGVICRLRQDRYGVWRGRWTQFEQMRIKLVHENRNPIAPHVDQLRGKTYALIQPTASLDDPDWNPGWTYITAGIEWLVRQIDPEAKFLRVNMLAPDDNGWDQMLAAADLAIVCGNPRFNVGEKAPYWDGELFRRLQTLPIPWVDWGPGATFPEPLKRKSEMFQALMNSAKNLAILDAERTALACLPRDPLAETILATVNQNTRLIPCSSWHAKDLFGVRPCEERSIDVITLKAMPAQEWLIPRLVGLARQMATERDLVVMVHNSRDRDWLMVNGWTGPDITFHADPKQILETYAAADRVLSFRLHASIPALSLGCRVCDVGSDSRSAALGMFGVRGVSYRDLRDIGFAPQFAHGAAPVKSRDRVIRVLHESLHE